MPDAKEGYVHANQVLPEIVNEAFQELKGLPMCVEYRDDPESFTSYEYSQGSFTICLGEELRFAPLAVKRGALAEELGKIARLVKDPHKHNVECAIRKYFNNFAIYKDYAIDVSMEENIDLIERGLGKDYIRYTMYLEKNCNYRWRPSDGYCLISLIDLNLMHSQGLEIQHMQ